MLCSVHGEMTTGNQTYDAATELYTQLIRGVASDLDVLCTNMHERFMDYEFAFNTQPAGGIPDGVLTVDGMCDKIQILCGSLTVAAASVPFRDVVSYLLS